MFKSAAILIFQFFLLLCPGALSATAATLTVGGAGTHASLTQALEQARDGDTVEVVGGVHRGPFTIDRSVRLRGTDWPVLDGDGQGTVVSIRAPGVELRGFKIRNSGQSLDQENSGVALEAPSGSIIGNRLEETLFGIYLRKASGSVVRDNHITSKDLELPRRGDPIRVWYSDDVTLEGNRVARGRDMVLWYSKGLRVLDNRVQDGRYGLHFMYCDDAQVQGNVLRDNSVGAFLMYSRRLRLIHNRITGNRGPSGYGVGLKDMDDGLLEGNLLADNRIGIHVDTSPREVDSTLVVRDNLIAFNDVGVEMLPSVRRNQYSGNSFVENGEQVAVAGGGQIRDNQWTIDGVGNYWSDYTGFDTDRDGFGDIPYRSQKVFQELMARNSSLRLLSYSPAAEAVDLAGKLFPSVRPEPELVDERPLMQAASPQGLPPLGLQSQRVLGATGAGLLLTALLLMGRTGFRSGDVRLQESTAGLEGPEVIQVKGLSKKFGSLQALDRLSFQVDSGESVALWGPNGAGKTTALRCLLGVLPFEGEIRIAGHTVGEGGKQARKMAGFVPQELAFHQDLSVDETLAFFACLRDSSPAGLLDRVGLEEHRHKAVQNLSGGLKQRLALAIALLGDPPLLILDEPTSNLDLQARDEFLEMLLRLKAGGKTLLFSSHRPEELQLLADRVVVLKEGRLLADGPPAEVAEQIGWRVALDFRFIDSEAAESARAVLEEGGFFSQRRDHIVRVEVGLGRKIQPMELLFEKGIHFQDLDMYRLNREPEHA